MGHFVIVVSVEKPKKKNQKKKKTPKTSLEKKA
jgi:hypothetical protein